MGKLYIPLQLLIQSRSPKDLSLSLSIGFPTSFKSMFYNVCFNTDSPLPAFLVSGEDVDRKQKHFVMSVLVDS